MHTSNSHNNVSIRLTDERWQHIVRGHPEMESQQSEVLQTIREPDRIQKGDSGELLAVRQYAKTPVTTDKFLIVAYRETSSDDGFIITAYFSSRISLRRATLWTRFNS